MRSYSFTDVEPIVQSVYYQLVQVDFDGTEHAYAVIVYQPDNTEGVRLYPNPVLHGQVTVHSEEHALLEIVNRSGQLVMTAMLKEGDNRISVKSLVPGMYIVRTGQKTFTMQIP